MKKDNFAILEIGSTNTKAYIYRNGDLEDYGQKFIAFKNNYSINKKLLESDIQELYKFIEEIKKEVSDIYAYGTSIFRKLDNDELENFKLDLENKNGVAFKVVSADEESYFTVKGVMANIDYDKRMAVVIGGGGSTEIAIIDNKEIINKINLDFGAMDITNSFPELKEDKVETDFDLILNHALDKISGLEDYSDILVLAGGDYIYFYQKAEYEMEDNFLYTDDNQKYLLEFDKLNFYDHDILTKSLDDIKKKCVGNENWWDGARGMRFCMNAVARKLNSKYIIPTKINMIIGLVDEIINN
jgi:Exopolyphosphatase